MASLEDLSKSVDAADDIGNEGVIRNVVAGITVDRDDNRGRRKLKSSPKRKPHPEYSHSERILSVK